MMMVETELRPSEIHGIGVYLCAPVRAGDLIWRFDSRIDRVFSNEELQGMPEQLRHFLRTYSTFHRDLGLWVLCGDNGRHFNHSDTPNTRSLGVAFGDDVAAKSILPPAPNSPAIIERFAMPCGLTATTSSNPIPTIGRIRR